MKTRTIKKVVIYTLSTFLFLVAVLCVHIYMVYRPKAPDANSRVMARIDINQPITETDASNIKVWLAHEKGIDNYLVNTETKIVVFTFLPVKTTGNQIVKDFKASFKLKAERFIPTADELSHSCPVAGSSYTYKIYKFISNLI
jgi:hypothetical protein